MSLTSWYLRNRQQAVAVNPLPACGSVIKARRGRWIRPTVGLVQVVRLSEKMLPRAIQERKTWRSLWLVRCKLVVQALDGVYSVRVAAQVLLYCH